MDHQSQKFDYLLYVQILFAALLAFFSVISLNREVLTEIKPISFRTDIALEFRIIGVAVVDYFLVLFVLLTVTRLIVKDDYQPLLWQNTVRVVRYSPLHWWLALIILTFISVTWANEYQAVLFTAFHSLLAVFAAITIASLVLENPVCLRLLLVGIVVGALVQASIAILQLATNGPLGLTNLGEMPGRFVYEADDYYRGRGLSTHANYLGGYLMIAFGALIWLSYLVQTRITRITLIIVSGVVLVGIVSTLSRSAILGTVTTLFLIGLSVIYKTGRATQRQIAFGFMGIAVIGLLLLGFVWLMLDADPANISERFFANREFFFDASWEVIEQHPLTGSGASNLMVNVAENNPIIERDLLPVHNTYLFVLAELGVFGVLVFMMGCIAILRHLLNFGSPLYIWTSVFAGICVIMLFDNYFWAVQPFRVLFLWVVGIWCGARLASMLEERNQSLTE